MAKYIPFLHFFDMKQEISRYNNWAELHTDYFDDCTLGDDEESARLLTTLDNLEDPKIIARFTSRALHGGFLYQEPLLSHHKSQFFEHLPLSAGERSKFESQFYDAVKHDRSEELLLLKMKRCLETGQIQRFRQLCAKIDIKKPNPHLKQADAANRAKIFMDKIDAFHKAGVQKESFSFAHHVEVEDRNYDWIFNLWVGANLDSGKLREMLKAMKSRLEKCYNADLHRLMIQIASIIAEKEEIVPLAYGVWPLPEDVTLVTKVLDKTQNLEHLEMWVEKVACTLDRLKAKEEDWLLLRKVFIDLIKVKDLSCISKILRTVFDDMRAKVWWKMHFKQIRNEFTYDKFFDLLWGRIFNDTISNNPMLKKHKKKFDKVCNMFNNNDEDFQESNEAVFEATTVDVVSEMKLSHKDIKTAYNFNKVLYNRIDLSKDVALYHTYQDDLIKLHIILKFMSKYLLRAERSKSQMYMFTQQNLEMAYQIMKNAPHGDERLEKIIKDFMKVRRESPRFFLFETDWSRLGTLFNYFLKKPIPKASEEVLSKLFTFKILHKTVKDDPELSPLTWKLKVLRRRYQQRLIWQPIEQKIKYVMENLATFSERWYIPEEILVASLEKFQTYVLQRFVPIKWAIERMFLSFNLEYYGDYSVNVQEFLKQEFDPISMYEELHSPLNTFGSSNTIETNG